MCPHIYNADNRAISPVIGTVLFLAIVLLLAALSGAFLFELTDQQDPAPQASLQLNPVDSSNDYRLVHRSGDNISGDRLTIRGVSDPDQLAGTALTAGDTIRLTPTEETIRLVWEEQRGAPSSYTLATFEVSADAVAAALPDSVVFTGTSGGILNITGDGGATSTITTDSEPTGLGPASDIDSDGTVEVPYVDSSGNIRLVETDDGSETLLADDSDISGSESIATTKTRLAVGSWDGSPQSVFFANENEDTLYRVAPGGSVVEVATPGNGVDGVIGPSDIDDDGTDELVFIDSSQTIRYLEADGSTGTTGVTAGSSSGVGGGSTADYDGDGSEEVAIVGGSSGTIYLASASSSVSIDGSDTDSGTAPSAAQSPPTAADVDDDGSIELVYVYDRSGDGDYYLRYLDNIQSIDGSGDIVIRDLTDASGNDVSGNVETGTT